MLKWFDRMRTAVIANVVHDRAHGLAEYLLTRLERVIFPFERVC
jgi:hypothetical protein